LAGAQTSIRLVRGAMSSVTEKLNAGWRLLTDDPRRLLRLVRFDAYKVFSAATDSIPLRPAPEGVTFRQMTAAEVAALAPGNEDIRDGMARCGALAGQATFGAFYNGAFAHLSWLVLGGRDNEKIARPHLFELRPGEAEITHCVTLPEFRGLHIYPYAISRVVQEARAQGARDVFMITRSGNVASQRGILRAGFSERRGRILYAHVYRARLILPTFRLWGPGSANASRRS